MKMEILKYLTTNAFNKINNLLKSPSERGQILEPLCCLYRLSLLPFYNDGVKISIYENKICINDIGYIQGVSRWSNGDVRNDLHNIFNPINRLYKFDYSSLYPNKEDFNLLLNNSIRGLEKLRNTYTDSNIIVHSLNLYIGIINDVKDGKNQEFNNKDKDDNKDDNKNNDNNLENSIIENHLYESFVKLWVPVNIIVLNNLLRELNNVYKKMNNEKHRANQELKKEMYNHYLDAYNNVLCVIDCNVSEIVKKVSAGV
tara:strand:- start:261 stop:1031 length:771 start_codon:yes stop_codon:yes gene_type:complete